MATTADSAITLSGLAKRLVTEGLIDQQIALEAHQKANKQKIPLITYLVENALVDSDKAASVASTEFGVPLFDVHSLDLTVAPIKLVEEKLVNQHRALPLYKRGNRLYVGVSDPTNLRGLDEIKFHTNLTVEPILVSDDALTRKIEEALSAADAFMDSLSEEEGLDDVDFAEIDDVLEDDSGGMDDSSAVDDTPVVRFINKVLLDAIKRGASDIHFEPYEHKYRVRFRMDGVLKQMANPPMKMSPRLAARLKVMSHLDIAEKRVPQDGRIKLNLSKSKAIDFRVSTCPTLFGEKIVLRILDASAAKMGIDKLGYEENQKELFVDAIMKPYGMVLVTGPTGSGKTVSLYTALNILNTEERNISTAEDPVEIRLPGVNQVQQNVKQGMTFPAALRSFLRQDPDIIMVGEIRDLETAEIAIKAAQTGHMVLSTLHTNDGPQTIARLMNMGIAPYNITSSVTLVIAQRLARRLHDCKQVAEIPHEALIAEGFIEEEMDELTIYEPVGCQGCNDGYKGRVGIYQVMPISENIQKIVLEGGNALQIAEQATKDGINDLRASALNKVREGVTGLAEINRVTKD